VRTAFVKITSLFLLLCITLHTTGLYLVFHVYQKEVKREMKKYLRQDLHQESIVAFLYSPANASDFVFVDEEEFALNGQMYDVIFKESKGGQTVIHAIDDKKETALVQAFLKHQRADHSCKAKMNGLGHFLTLLYLANEPSEIKIAENTVTNRWAHCLCTYPKNEQLVLKPPPRLIA
jgi:hypothetical protein